MELEISTRTPVHHGEESTQNDAVPEVCTYG